MSLEFITQSGKRFQKGYFGHGSFVRLKEPDLG
jgi:hypothetical protein